MEQTNIGLNRARFGRRTFARRVALPVIAAAAAWLAASTGVRAQTHQFAASDDAGPFTPDATIVDIMDAIVMPSAEELWEAVSVAYTKNGPVEHKPETDEDWEHLRWSAIALAEAANLLIIPDRRVDEPASVPDDPDSELGPKEIASLIEMNRDAWIGYAHVLHQTALDSLHAVDAHDADALLEVGGSIDAACEACHLQFWYPEAAP